MAICHTDQTRQGNESSDSWRSPRTVVIFVFSFFHFNHFSKQLLQANSDGPLRKMTFQFPKVRYVANMVPDPVRIRLGVVNTILADFFNQSNALEHRGCILSTSP